MVEPEIAFADLSDAADLAEEMLKYVFKAVLEERADDMAFFQQRVDKTVLERLDDMRRLPTHVQLAKFIYQGYLMSNQRLIKLRQSDYAERLGVTVLTAHKALNTLLTLNLIEKKYGGVEIVNTQKLAEYLSDNTSLLPL